MKAEITCRGRARKTRNVAQAPPGRGATLPRGPGGRRAPWSPPELREELSPRGGPCEPTWTHCHATNLKNTTCPQCVQTGFLQQDARPGKRGKAGRRLLSHLRVTPRAEGPPSCGICPASPSEQRTAPWRTCAYSPWPPAGAHCFPGRCDGPGCGRHTRVWRPSLWPERRPSPPRRLPGQGSPAGRLVYLTRHGGLLCTRHQCVFPTDRCPSHGAC